MEWEGAVSGSSDMDEIPIPLPLASESQQPYVSELLSFTLDRLHKEPELLRVDAERIRRQMQEVAVANYRSFIAASDALLAIRHEVSSIDNHLESMVFFFFFLIFHFSISIQLIS
jgi:hypothetical protein